MTRTLVQPLFDGPLDIVGDIHGELEALGNHDLNILLDHPKNDNRWFYGKEFQAKTGKLIPQEPADESLRGEIRDFFATLPLALARDDLRVVHASWEDAMIQAVAGENDVTQVHERHRARIESEVEGRDDLDAIAKGLEYQNRNPVKWITSGPEERDDNRPASDDVARHERRVPWRNDYDAEAFCLFGHYSLPLNAEHGTRRAFCIDNNVGKRWTERHEESFDGTFTRTKLAALRYPERAIVFDDGSRRTAILGQWFEGNELFRDRDAF